MENTKKDWNKKGQKVSGGMVKKKNQQSSEEQKTKLELEILSNSALDENRAGRVTEGKGKRGCRVESTLVE